MWVRAMHRYANVLRVVEPKRLRYEGAKSDLDATMSALREKQDKLKEVEEHIAQLQVRNMTRLPSNPFNSTRDNCIIRFNA